MSQTSATTKEIGGFPIDQDGKIWANYTAHDPLNHRVAKACLSQDQFEDVSVYAIKRFLDVKFEDKRL